MDGDLLLISSSSITQKLYTLLDLKNGKKVLTLKLKALKFFIVNYKKSQLDWQHKYLYLL